MYDWKKTLIKFGKAATYVFIAGFISVYSDQPWFLVIAPVIHAAENYFRHQDKKPF